MSSASTALLITYLGSIYADVGLVLAGHAKGQRAHVLPRACADPPQELQRQIFPFVEAEEHKVLAVSILIAGPTSQQPVSASHLA